MNRGNKEVTVVEMLNKYGRDIGPSTRWTIIGELKRLGVNIVTGARALEVREEGLEIEKREERAVLEADSIVVAAGSESENSLFPGLENRIKEVHVIGDAKEPRKALDAIEEGFLAGLKI